MTNPIQTFNFTQAEVRTSTDKNGEPLFCLKDVASILSIQNHNEIVRNQLDKNGVDKVYLTDNLGRQQQVTFISEPNLYRVIFRSNKPDAVKFQNWIFDEVIPQIRKTGGYNTNQTNVVTTVIQPIVNYQMPSGDFVGKFDENGRMNIRQLRNDEFVTSFKDLPQQLEQDHRLTKKHIYHLAASAGAINEKIRRIATLDPSLCISSLYGDKE